MNTTLSKLILLGTIITAATTTPHSTPSQFQIAPFRLKLETKMICKVDSDCSPPYITC